MRERDIITPGRVRKDLVRAIRCFLCRRKRDDGRADRSSRIVVLRKSSRIRVAGINNHNAWRLDLVEYRHHPLRMLRLYRQLEVREEFAFVPPGVVYRLSIAIRPQIMCRKTPLATVITHSKWHVRVDRFRSEWQHPHRATVVN